MKLTVLVVDDDALVVESLRRQLQGEYDVITSTEPTAALASTGGYDVVLADFYMPQMNGTDFLKLVRQAQPWVRRVLITGGTAFEIAQKAVDDAEVHGFLVKPVTTRHLSETLRSLLAARLTSPSRP